MADSVVNFIFTVASTLDDPDLFLPTDKRLDSFNDIVVNEDIFLTLGQETRLASNLLLLKKLKVYAGPGGENGDLPDEDAVDENGRLLRYGRPMFVGWAAGKNIFNDPANMETDEKRFNHFLDEIFRSHIVLDGELKPYVDIPEYDDPNNRPEPFLWEGAWTVAPLPENCDIEGIDPPPPMGGHTC